jgi:hypothetical protein
MARDIRKRPYHTRLKWGKGLSRTKCLGGDHFLTTEEHKKGRRVCTICEKRNGHFAQNAEGVAVDSGSDSGRDK